jgi:peroxiredoxin
MHSNSKQTGTGLNEAATGPVKTGKEGDAEKASYFRTTASGFSNNERRNLGVLVVITTVVLVGLSVSGLLLERLAGSSLIEPGQAAPGFALPSTDGLTLSLSQVKGRPVLLVFVPAINCGLCRQQLVAVQAAFSQLQAKNVVVYGISTDTLAVQRLVGKELGLSFPILSEAPTLNQHPVGSAYGFYHQEEPAKTSEGPVDSNGLVIIDPAGIVRAVKVAPGQVISSQEILQFAQAGLKPTR